LSELVDTREPALPLVRGWINHADNPCEILPPSERRDDVLLGLQVTTRSPLGAVAYETGGLLIDGGWLRFLGSGHPRLTRDLLSWNGGRAHGAFLIADDAAGGFFALNGGALGEDLHHVYYWPPDSLEWEATHLGYGDFLRWALSAKLREYYTTLRWPTWKEDAAALSGDRCFSFHPFLWTKEGSLAASRRADVPVSEAYDLKIDVVRQMNEKK
jgi:hypothetical protein